MTLKEIAAEAGVSISTVSRVIKAANANASPKFRIQSHRLSPHRLCHNSSAR